MFLQFSANEPKSLNVCLFSNPAYLKRIENDYSKKAHWRNTSLKASGMNWAPYAPSIKKIPCYPYKNMKFKSNNYHLPQFYSLFPGDILFRPFWKYGMLAYQARYSKSSYQERMFSPIEILVAEINQFKIIAIIQEV